MAARCFQDLVVWQLADALRAEIYRRIASSAARDDRRFRDDLQAAATSVASNVAEGFARYRPADFHRFLTVAKASLAEVESHLHDGELRGYFTPEQNAPAAILVKRTTVAMARLIRYLRSSDAAMHARSPRSEER